MSGNIRKDSRFDHIANDVRFKRIPKSERKVKIDKRFQSMFSDEKFKVKYTVDKRGRPVNHSNSEDLRNYYELSSDETETETDSSDDEDAECKSNSDDDHLSANLSSTQNFKIVSKFDGEEQNIANTKTSTIVKKGKKIEVLQRREDTKTLPADIKEKLHDTKVDYARGEGVLMSDSSSDESSGDDTNDLEVEHGWGELDCDAERTDEITRRLAICNMDWDRIRASDLMVLLNSFLPPGGLIHSITIYPSEFGLERMAKEDQSGPAELCSRSNAEDEGDGPIEENEGNENEKHVNEKLRQYQLNRLKYYYAVVVCDTPSSANKLYTECDGLEYESSATKLDLRFIPDDTMFEQEPREVCNQLPDLSKYEPRYFTNTALQQAKVDLTWDETDPARAEVAQKVFAGKVDDADLQAYLASSSGEDEASGKEDVETAENDDMGRTKNVTLNQKNSDPISRYRALLQGIEEDEEKKKSGSIDLEITWGVSLKDKTQQLVDKKLKEGDGLTPFQQMIEKKKQKKKLKKEEKKKNIEMAEDGNNLYSDDDIPSDIDMNDPYFAEEFKDMPNKANNKLKKKKKNERKEEDDPEAELKKAELELLLMDEEDTRKHFSLKKIQEQELATSGNKKKYKKLLKKKLKDKEKAAEQDDFKVNVNDERFSALFSSHHFNIDPADPHYKKTKGMEEFRLEKLKRRAAQEEPHQATSNGPKHMHGKKKDVELSMLVKSIKRKTKSKFKS